MSSTTTKHFLTKASASALLLASRLDQPNRVLSPVKQHPILRYLYLHSAVWLWTDSYYTRASHQTLYLIDVHRTMAPASFLLKHLYDRSSNGAMLDPSRRHETYAGDDISTDTSRPTIGDIINNSASGDGKGIAGSNSPLQDLENKPKDR